MCTVWYPASFSQAGSVFACVGASFSQPPCGGAFPITVWLWPYCPVRNVVREGQQSGNET